MLEAREPVVGDRRERVGTGLHATYKLHHSSARCGRRAFAAPPSSARFSPRRLLLGLVGGLAGLAAASLMQFASFSTTNFQTFADLAFRFTLTPSIVAKTIAFALAMALIGGFLAAVRAARLEIVDALRAS